MTFDEWWMSLLGKTAIARHSRKEIGRIVWDHQQREIATLKQEVERLAGLLREFSDALPSDEYMREQGKEPGPLLKKIRTALEGLK